MTLAGRHAIITGAGRGLGAEIARHFVEAGASVLLCSRSDGELAHVRYELSAKLASDQKLLTIRCDVADPASVDRMIGAAVEAFGGFDIVVNNAAIQGPMGRLEDLPWQEWIDTLMVDLCGTVYVCRAAVPHLRHNRYGKIINLSGGGATAPLPGFTAYACAKAAVVRFTETLALEVRNDGIDVNAVAPGVLKTQLLDQVIAAGPDRIGADYHRRMVAIRESGAAPLSVAAGLCLYLASSASDGITGRLIAAQWDPWAELQVHRTEIDGSDIYTLRRILPKDRGFAWGDE